MLIDESMLQGLFLCPHCMTVSDIFFSEMVFLFFLELIVFIYLWLQWVFVAVRAFLQLWQAGATLQLWCTGFSFWWLLLLQSINSGQTGFSGCSTRALQSHVPGSRALAQELWCIRLSCPMACRIFLDQGTNPCLLHCQVDSYSLCHQKVLYFLNYNQINF